jgi:cytochrome c oxidase subunit 3
MQALPAAPAPPPRRQLFFGTALACGAGAMLIGAMTGVWMLMRDRTLATEESWVPSGVTIPEVPTNIMLLGFVAVVTFAQWAVYAAKQGDRQHTALALGTTAVMAVAIINAQIYAYAVMDLPVTDGAYGSMFYAITGTTLALMVIGLVFSIVAALRFLGGRTDDHEVVAAHALYWYFVSAAFAVVWFFVYVTK